MLGGGATLAGIILGSITVLIIDRELLKASIFALVGAGLTWFGLIHSQAIGFGRTPAVAFAYVSVAAVLFVCARTTSSSQPVRAEASGSGLAAEAT